MIKKQEENYRLLSLLVFGILLSISLASAVSMSAPYSADTNENFNLAISGSGFYALEMNIPSNLQIISDPSGGQRTGEVYKTVTTGSLTLTLKGIYAGTYTIYGQYTDGSGIKDLNSEIILIEDYVATPTCPTCQSSTAWSNCENNQQIRYVYSCSSSTNYQCVQSTEFQSCSIPDSSGDSSTTTENPKCTATWVCKDDYTLAYQSSDCSLSSIQKCSSGCENRECKIPPSVVEPNSTIQVTINQAGTKETTQSIFAKIINFIKSIIDFLIFWD